MKCLEIILTSTIALNLYSALLFAFFIYLFQRFRYYKNLWRKFNKTTFEVFLKGDSKPIRTVEVKVIGNLLKFEGEHLDENSGQGEFSGEFIINPINLRIGEGFHLHKSYDGFNFPKIIIKDDNTFFTETAFIQNQDGNFNPSFQAFVWKRKKSGKKN